MSSLMDILGGPGGPPGGAPGPGGPPGGAPADDGTSQYSDSMQALDVAEHALHAFIKMDQDAMDRATATKALSIVVGLQGSHQADAQKGGSKSLMRAIGGGPPGLPGLAPDRSGGGGPPV